MKIGIDNQKGFFGPPKAFIQDNEIGVSFTGNSQESREFIILYEGVKGGQKKPLLSNTLVRGYVTFTIFIINL